MKTPSISVLQLEIEGLKDNMSNVQSEIAMCMASLSIQHNKVCDAVNRLESVSIIVKAIIEINATEDNLSSLKNSSKKNIREAFDSVATDISAVRTSEELLTTHSNIKVDDIKEPSMECDSELGKDDDRKINTRADLSLSTIRPSLTNKKIKAKVVHHQIREEAKVASSQTVTDALIKNFPTTNPVLRSNTTSFPGSFASCQATTSASVKMTVNKVKDICRNHGWRLEGCHSTRAGKENSAVVHFYKVSVKMLEKEKVVRGVGTSKAEAVKRAFKSMELFIRDAIAINENGSKEGFRKMSNDGLSDDIVNFDENPLIPCKPCASSEDSLSQPPVFHAQTGL